MSIAASGTYGKALTFGTWKGRPYVRERVDPSNPKSAKQQGVRAMLKYLAQIWATIKVASAASWGAAATAKSISTFNAYISANLKNWQEDLAPIRLSTDARAATPRRSPATSRPEPKAPPPWRSSSEPAQARPEQS
jgi:hypothetical protein